MRDAGIAGDKFMEPFCRSLYKHIQITAISLLQQIGGNLGYKAGTALYDKPSRIFDRHTLNLGIASCDNGGERRLVIQESLHIVSNYFALEREARYNFLPL